MPSTHRGQRNAAKEIDRLPTWATVLLTTLRNISAPHRNSALRILRFIHNLLEREWEEHWETDSEPDIEAQPQASLSHHDALPAAPAPTAPPAATDRPTPPWAKRQRA